MADERFGGAQLLVLDDDRAVAAEAARRTIAALQEAVAANGAAHVALTGGSSAVPLYRELGAPANRDQLDWRRVHLWWADERFVPTDHPESNAGLAYRLLLGIAPRSGQSGSGADSGDVERGDLPGISIDPQNVHPVEVEETLSESDPIELAAQRYGEELRRWVPLRRHGIPQLDVIMSGVGPDGHVMSVFPGSPALAHDAEPVVHIAAPEHVEPHLPRVTLSARLLAAAGLVLIMATGSGKREILQQVLGDERNVERWPAQAALLPHAVWLLDRAAAPEGVTRSSAEG